MIGATLFMAGVVKQSLPPILAQMKMWYNWYNKVAYSLRGW